MTKPDLSFLMRKADPAASESDTSQWPAQERRSQPVRPSGPVAKLIAQLRTSQAELEAQNEVLRYSQAAAESASDRFEALFTSVPLALMVIDAHDMVVQANPMAHRSFQPHEDDRPL
ncbi:MAG: PAS domain-containing protein, partial [Giesbergeria sp.]